MLENSLSNSPDRSGSGGLVLIEVDSALVIVPAPIPALPVSSVVHASSASEAVGQQGSEYVSAEVVHVMPAISSVLLPTIFGQPDATISSAAVPSVDAPVRSTALVDSAPPSEDALVILDSVVVDFSTVQSAEQVGSSTTQVFQSAPLNSLPPRLRCKNKGFLTWFGANPLLPAPVAQSPLSSPPPAQRDIFVCSEQQASSRVSPTAQDPVSSWSPPYSSGGPSAADQIRKAMAGLSPEQSDTSGPRSPVPDTSIANPVLISSSTEEFASGDTDPDQQQASDEDDFVDIFLPYVDMRVVAHYAFAYVIPPCETPSRVIRKAMQAAHPSF